MKNNYTFHIATVTNIFNHVDDFEVDVMDAGWGHMYGQVNYLEDLGRSLNCNFYWDCYCTIYDEHGKALRWLVYNQDDGKWEDKKGL